MIDWRKGYVCPRYMCILLYVKLMWCSGVPYIYGKLEKGVKLNVIMTQRFGVVVFHRSDLGLSAFWYSRAMQH